MKTYQILLAFSVFWLAMSCNNQITFDSQLEAFVVHTLDHYIKSADSIDNVREVFINHNESEMEKIIIEQLEYKINIENVSFCSSVGFDDRRCSIIDSQLAERNSVNSSKLNHYLTKLQILDSLGSKRKLGEYLHIHIPDFEFINDTAIVYVSILNLMDSYGTGRYLRIDRDYNLINDTTVWELCLDCSRSYLNFPIAY